MTPRIGPMSEVVVMRCGYASDAAWWAVINFALAHHCDVHAIDAQGHSVHYLAADGRVDLPEVPDW